MLRVVICGACLCTLGGVRPAPVLAQVFPPMPASPLRPRFVRPALDPARIGGELVVGAYGGLGGWFAGEYVGHLISDEILGPDDVTRRRMGLAFGVVGGGLGTAGGVFSIGTIGNQSGSFPATLLGAGIGAGAAWGLDRLLFGSKPNSTSNASKFRWTEALIGTVLPSIGATIGFNSSRRLR